LIEGIWETGSLLEFFLSEVDEDKGFRSLIFTEEEEFLYVGEMDEFDEFNGFGTIYIRFGFFFWVFMYFLGIMD
jgi:hypothetical protein